MRTRALGASNDLDVCMSCAFKRLCVSSCVLVLLCAVCAHACARAAAYVTHLGVHVRAHMCGCVSALILPAPHLGKVYAGRVVVIDEGEKAHDCFIDRLRGLCVVFVWRMGVASGLAQRHKLIGGSVLNLNLYCDI